jgi:hypothetical protein
MKTAMTNTINIMAVRAYSLASEDEQITSAQKKTNQKMIKLFTDLTIWSTVTADWNDPNWYSWDTRAVQPSISSTIYGQAIFFLSSFRAGSSCGVERPTNQRNE